MGILSSASDKYQVCIDSCARCAQACHECFTACLNEPDVAQRKNCIALLCECARMCEMSVSMMSMNGQYVKEHCQLCAVICDKCAAECGNFLESHCQECSSECKRCAEDCRNMSAK